LAFPLIGALENWNEPESEMTTLRDIELAYRRIRPSILESPLVASQAFSELCGNDILLKLENLQITGSFKERGALNRILTMSEEEKRHGVVCMSAGNHAQAVAYHATKHGIRSVICMPIGTALVKVSRTKHFGGEVILTGNNFDEAGVEARRQATEYGLTMLHAFDDPAVIAGQGSLGLELLEQNPFLEAVVVPIGGGGLIGGVACAIKETNPKIKIIGVESARVPSMKAALAEGKPTTVSPAKTIADGIAVRKAGELTLPLVQKYVDEIVTVEEDEIANAILLLLEREKTVAEGAGAAGVAAAVQDKLNLRGKRVAVVVCGGNIDVTLVSRIIERGLVKDGRLLRLRLYMPDIPGSLETVVRLVSMSQANIVEVEHDRSHYGVSLGDTVIDVTMETRGADHIQEIETAFTKAGFGHKRIL
jgi:threonine dehydratase